MALSLGAIVAILETALILSLSAFDLTIQKFFRTFLYSRSVVEKNVPRFKGQDTSPLLLPRTVFKFWKYPEVIAGLGIQASNQCNSISVNGLVTSSNFDRYSDSLKMSRSIGSISQLSAVTFLDGPLSVVPQHFPKDISSSICTKCISEKDAILSNCVVEKEPPISPGALDITIGKIDGPLQTAVQKIENRTRSATQFHGLGDVIVDQFNFETCTMFYFGSDQNNDEVSKSMQLKYFEYSNSRHCHESLGKVNSNPQKVVTLTNDHPVTVQKITCDRTLLNNNQIFMAMVMHRTFEYEITLNRNRSDLRLPGLRPLNGSDPILAILAYALAVGSPEPGSYEVYTVCGKYDWRYIYPVFGVIVFLLLLLLISQISRKSKEQDLEYGLDAQRLPYLFFSENMKIDDSFGSHTVPSRTDDDDSV